MASGGIFGTLGKSRAQRFYLKGSLFFLLLHMFIGTSASESTSPMASDASVSAAPGMTTPAAISNSENTVSYMTPAAISNSENTVSYMTSAPSDNTSHITNNMTLSDNVTTDWTNTSSSGNSTTLSCPAFTCTTDCSAKFMNESATTCPSASAYCELIKQAMSYSIKCSVSCGMSCGNGTVTNCSLACCNTSSCLNASLLALSGSLSTTAPTTPSTTATTVKVTVPPTPANNGKKCLSIKCDGAACYKNTNSFALVFCPIGQEYCMLNKVTVNSLESWQGGCSVDCRKAQVCSSGLATCHLECCNATAAASCLKLTGELNMPSSATRGPQSPALLTASLLLLWMMKILT
ncbi:mucin-2 [Triplophysa rosa]|uniref:Uncharacterized protein n=1 Tax=Triplophysa rosa TaxID=992332 RepID=A0A9W8C4V6_TRIRA|nr:mucin-2 [Triplophysa rosa]KAI7807223.1 putative protein TPRXL [Triplophysa rosa]